MFIYSSVLLYVLQHLLDGNFLAKSIVLAKKLYFIAKKDERHIHLATKILFPRQKCQLWQGTYISLRKVKSMATKYYFPR